MSLFFSSDYRITKKLDNVYFRVGFFAFNLYIVYIKNWLGDFVTNLYLKSLSLEVFGKIATICALSSVVLLYLDTRVLSGEPLWLKPFKFFLSKIILTGTLNWLIRRFGSSPRATRRYCQIIVWGLYFELAVIVVQATRGVKSHFNNHSVFDMSLFVLMGIVISAVVIAAFLTVFAVTDAKSKLSLSERAAGRLGIVLFLVAAFLGNLMGFFSLDGGKRGTKKGINVRSS